MSGSTLLAPLNPFYLYTDFTIKLFNFQTQYGLSLINSYARAMDSISDFPEASGETIQNKFRGTFDSELKNRLKSPEFCNSLSEFIGSYVEFSSLLYHDRSYKFLQSVMNNLDPMAEPIRDVFNRTPSK